VTLEHYFRASGYAALEARSAKRGAEIVYRDDRQENDDGGAGPSDR
jgi:hypothetical protein